MFRQKLNPKVLQHFKTKTNQEVGFMCILQLPKTHGICGYSSEVQRYSRLEEANYRKTLINAATVIQKNVRKFLAQHLLTRLKLLKQKEIQNQNATIIQKHIRQHLAKKKLVYLKLMKNLLDIREGAAKCIQKNYRISLLKKNIHILNLIGCLRKIRTQAAVRIQKVLRSYFVRKELYFIRNKKLSLLITWWYPAKNVSIAGSFTYPPWKMEIPLIYSPLLKAFYSSFFIENNLQPARYYLKFIVDNMWLCDGKMQLAQDLEGNYNNVLTVFKENFVVRKSASTRNFVLDDFQKPQLGETKVPRIYSGNINSIGAAGFLKNEDCNLTVKLYFGSFMASHPRKKNAELEMENSADVCFADFDEQIFGIADGVGEWESFGIDPSMFPKELIENFRKEFMLNRLSSGVNDFEICGYLEKLLNSAYKRTKNYGSSTVLLGILRQNHLYTLSLGDSSFLVLRPRENKLQLTEIFRLVEQQHTFNCPYQLSRMPEVCDYEYMQQKGFSSLISFLKRNSSAEYDLPQDARAEIIPLQPCDIVIIGTDGLFDNLYDSDIIRIAEQFLHYGLTPESFCQKLAKELVMQAINKGWDTTYKSPFSKNASKYGKRYLGGKLDDTTVIVSIAMEESAVFR
ncbi:hypothetical protein SteCoe_12498 [Stentor coeruleus]|uniref:Protein phosphatase n=1 Tax=Stentor coeruleus TaxID=5963 RepID=A0A1R2CAP2_9CILI|nr:hypothetical protein SteCoe_12498 [Stentor coeruleus]